MEKRKFSKLEIVFIVLFCLVVAVACVLIGILATREPASQSTQFSPNCPSVEITERIDCIPDEVATKALCARRGCCWSPLSASSALWCFFSSDHGYRMDTGPRDTPQGLEATLTRLPSPSLFGQDVSSVLLTVQFQTQTRLRFMQWKSRVSHLGAFSPENRDTRCPCWRFDTTIGPLIYSEQFLQISIKLPSDNIYGVGEHVHKQFRHDVNWKTWPMFRQDTAPSANMDYLYGVQTFFMCLEDTSGASLGVFLMNSNAMEFALQPAPAVTNLTNGGILDFCVVLGDTPEQVVQEYVTFIGLPALPSYWTLGFQLSRYGYESLEEVKAIVERNRAIGLPYPKFRTVSLQDVQYTDIDYMEARKDFTYDKVNYKDLPSFQSFLHNYGKEYILILDPAISTESLADGSPYLAYERGQNRNIWVNKSDGVTPLAGEVWPGRTVFPDFTNPECTNWWVEECQIFYNQVPYDGIWIDMNEAASFVPGSARGCEQNDLNYPPFTPWKFAGHWLGDNAATWEHLHWAIPSMLEFSLFSIPRKNPLGLIVTLDDANEAIGELFCDDGESTGTVTGKNYISYDFKVSSATLIQGLQLELGKSYSLRWTLGISNNEKFDCDPNPSASQENCKQLGCTWEEVTSDFSIPYCYYNGPDNGYSIADVMYASSGVTANVTFTQEDLEESQKSTSPISTLRLEVIYHTNHMLQFKFRMTLANFYDTRRKFS
ncbi:hypothetical protein Q9966_016361 [Columba livia]|nr:hypothetical protein Q9966_016361 [Columba livia]